MNIMSSMSFAPGVQLNILLIWWRRGALCNLSLKLILDHSDLFSSNFMTISLKSFSKKLWIFLRQSSSWLSRLLNDSINLDSIFFLFNTLLDVEV
jgi:hypothetical protein